jgi:hypothetical protein
LFRPQSAEISFVLTNSAQLSHAGHAGYCLPVMLLGVLLIRDITTIKPIGIAVT